jgi:hypothetical protein
MGHKWAMAMAATASSVGLSQAAKQKWLRGDVASARRRWRRSWSFSTIFFWEKSSTFFGKKTWENDAKSAVRSWEPTLFLFLGLLYLQLLEESSIWFYFLLLF